MNIIQFYENAAENITKTEPTTICVWLDTDAYPQARIDFDFRLTPHIVKFYKGKIIGTFYNKTLRKPKDLEYFMHTYVME